MLTKQAINALAEEVSKMETGLLTHLFLQDRLEVDKNAEPGKYHSRVYQLSRELKKGYGKFLRIMRGKGYEIVEHGKEIDHIEDRFVRTIIHQGKVVADSSLVRLDGMEDEDRDRTVMKAQKMANVLLMSRNSLGIPSGRGAKSISSGE